MKFTLGTISSSLDFQEDLKLIKSSLLYADEIELIGMAEYAVFNYLPERIDAVYDIESLADSFIPFLKTVPSTETKQLITQLEYIKETVAPYTPYLRKKKRRNKQEILAQIKAKKIIEECRDTPLTAMEVITNGSATAEISKLINKKIISIFNYDIGLSLTVIAPNVVSAFLKTLNMASAAKQEVKEKQKQMQGNTMYYYYKATKG